MYRRILVPIDGSKTAARGLREAIRPREGPGRRAARHACRRQDSDHRRRRSRHESTARACQAGAGRSHAAQPGAAQREEIRRRGRDGAVRAGHQAGRRRSAARSEAMEGRPDRDGHARPARRAAPGARQRRGTGRCARRRSRCCSSGRGPGTVPAARCRCCVARQPGKIRVYFRRRTCRARPMHDNPQHARHFCFVSTFAPSCPASLKRLEELANNLWYSWDRPARTLFARLDAGLWQRVGHSPKALLRNIDQKRLRAAADDPIFLSALQRVMAGFDAYHGAALGTNHVPPHGAGRTDRLLLRRVRPARKPADLLGRARHPRGRPLQDCERPAPALRRRWAAVPTGLFSATHRRRGAPGRDLRRHRIRPAADRTDPARRRQRTAHRASACRGARHRSGSGVRVSVMSH